jgi:hypothetical protein
VRLQRRRELADARFEFGSNAGVRTPGLVMTVHNSPLNRWRLHQVLGHMSWTKIRTACFGAKLSLYINTFFEENALKKRVLIPEHETLVGGRPMGGLKALKIPFVDADGLLELLDVFGPAFSEGSLGLPVSLLPLL